MANIYDIAKESGVSRSTVSRVINNQPSVSAEKKARVLAAIDKLKYTPSATARALATNKTNTIGVTSRELAHSFYDEFINSIHYGADDRSYGVLYTMRNAYSKTNIEFSSLMSKKVDGYMFVGEGTVTKEELEDLIHNQVPVIGYQFNYDIEHGLFININNYDSAYQATKYLFDLNHNHVIHLTYDSGLQEMQLREDGYYKAVKDLGIERTKVIKVPFDHHEIFEKCQAVIPYIADNKITAAFCANNVIASVLIEVLIENGYSVPGDFSVVGFDDTPAERPLHISRQKIPEITSIKQPQKEMAEYGINAMLNAIEAGVPIETGNRIFDCSFIVRNTTAYRK